MYLQSRPALIAEILSQLISPHLFKVTFSMRLSGVRSWGNQRAELHSFDWKGVADVLMGPQFTTLRTVQACLVFDEDLHYNGWKKLVRARWSDFAKRGILVVKKQHGFKK